VLHDRVLRGDVVAVRSLCSGGVDIASPAGRAASTPLHLAATHGRLDVVECLLAHGANAGERNKLGATALFAAARR
jgi:ankyrin repeat protein